MLQSNKSKKIPLIVVAVYLILVLLATIPVAGSPLEFLNYPNCG